MSNFMNSNTETDDIKSDVTTIISQLAGTTVQNGLNVKHASGSITTNINCKEDNAVKLELGSYDGSASTATLELATNNGGAQNGVEMVYTNSSNTFSVNRINSGTSTQVLSFVKSSNNVTLSGALTDSNGTTITSAEKLKLAVVTTKGINRCLEKIASICDGRRMYPDYLITIRYH